MENRNYFKGFIVAMGYLIDILLVLLAFLCGTAGKAVIISAVATMILVLIIIKLVKNDAISDNMFVFVGKWSFNVTTCILGLILELICMIFAIDIISKFFEKLNK